MITEDLYLKYKNYILENYDSNMLFKYIYSFYLYINNNNIDLEEINESLLKEYINHLKKEEKNNAYINNCIIALRTFLRWLYYREKILGIVQVEEALKNIKQPKREFREIKYIKLRDLNMAIKRLTLTQRELSNPYKIKLFLHLAYFTGFTQKQMENLEISSFDIKFSRINLNGNIYFYPKHLNELLYKYIDSTKLENGKLFEQKFIKNLISRCGSSRFTKKHEINMKNLRKSFIYMLSYKKTDYYSTKYLGQLSKTMTTHYAYKPTMKDIENTYRKKFK